MTQPSVIVKPKRPSVGISGYVRAQQFANRCGLPKNVPFASQNITWQISPDDSAMTASIEIRGAVVTACVVMKYLNRSVEMVKIVFDGFVEKSVGLLYPNDLESAIRCFMSHVQNMMYGPIRIPSVKAA